MLFDTTNEVIKLCIEGMDLEGEGRQTEAYELFLKAWDESNTNIERFTSAHYVARHQQNVSDKLKWDEIALNSALSIEDESVKGVYPSLCLNVGKCYEDLNDFEKALEYYRLGESFIGFLPDDGYGNMMRNGIKNGINRVNSEGSSEILDVGEAFM